MFNVYRKLNGCSRFIYSITTLLLLGLPLAVSAQNSPPPAPSGPPPGCTPSGPPKPGCPPPPSSGGGGGTGPGSPQQMMLRMQQMQQLQQKPGGLVKLKKSECLAVECLVEPLRAPVVVAFLVVECQNQECLAVLSLVLVKMLVELDLAVHKISRVQLEL